MKSAAYGLVAGVVGVALAITRAACAEPQALEAPARLSPRPALCYGTTGVWQRVRYQAMAAQCADLALAYSWAETQPKDAIAHVEGLLSSSGLAGRQRRLESLRIGAILVRARAWAAQGMYQQAFAAFSELEKRFTVDRWDALSLHSYAVAAAMVGQDEIAVELYRRLVAVVRWLPEPRRERVGLEAAAAALRAQSPAPREAISYLELAVSSAPSPLQLQMRLGLTAAARLLLGQNTEEFGAFLDASSELAEPNRFVDATEQQRAFARLPESDWRLLNAVARWQHDHDLGVWRSLEGLNLPLGHRVVVERMLHSKRALP